MDAQKRINFPQTICKKTSNHLSNYSKHKEKGRKCDAFEWMPSDILTGRHNHVNPYPGDNGIRFEPVKVQKKK